MDTTLPPMEILPFGNDRIGFVEALRNVYNQVRDASSGYLNRSSLFHFSEIVRSPNGSRVSFSPSLDLKDVVLLAAICSAPLAYRGSTDKGKSALAELGLIALFGEHGKQWQRFEVNRAMSQEDVLDIDLKKLAESTLSESLSALPYLSYPARLYDEVNRAPSKCINVLLHIIDGSGLNVRGDLNIPVGFPYRVGDRTKRYSFTIVTANHATKDYDGVFAEDAALSRRIVISLDLDDLPPSAQDVAQLLESRRPKIVLPHCKSLLEPILRIHESLPETVPLSPMSSLFLHYLSGLGTCVRTRSGRQRLTNQAAICEKCHLKDSTRFCGRVGGVSEGLLLWIKEIATGIAAIRNAKVLDTVHQDCANDRCGSLQKLLNSSAKGIELYDDFRAVYLADFAVKGEDVAAAYALVAPNHVRIDRAWLVKQEAYEGSESYAFADVANSSWASLQGLLAKHKSLFDELTTCDQLSVESQAELEALVTTEDAAMLAVASALSSGPLPLKFREALTGDRAASPVARSA